MVVAQKVSSLLRAFAMHGNDLRVQMDIDAVARQRIGENLRRIALFPGQKRGLVLRDDDPRSEAAKSLRELTAQRTPADDQETRGQGIEAEDILVRPVARFGKTRNRRGERMGSGCNEGLLGRVR